MKDNPCKWYAVMVGAMFFVLGITASVDILTKHWETQSAMENGYEQIETESGKLIWTRTEKSNIP